MFPLIGAYPVAFGTADRIRALGLEFVSYVSSYHFPSSRASSPHPAFGTPLPRAGEGQGVRARYAALALREMVRFAFHEETVSTLSGDRLGL